MHIAVVQSPGTRAEAWRETQALLAGLVERAAHAGAELVVLPECVWPAYVLGSRSAYLALRAAGLPGPDAFLAQLGQWARRWGLMLCAGYVEERGDALYNSAALVGPDGGVLGIHRKCFLWDFDREWFAPGMNLEPIATPIGPVGVMICADARLPEIPATLAARGARLLLQPTGWVNAGDPHRPWNPQPEFLVPARAREFGIPVASASKWGREGATGFVGSSLICNARGDVLARCGSAGTELVTADVEPCDPTGPVVTEEERRRLLSEEPPEPPAEVGRLWLLLVPEAGPASEGAIQADMSARTPVDAWLAIAPPTEPVPRLRESTSTQVACLAGPVASPFDLGRARLAALSASDLPRFAPARCQALCGVHLIVFYGRDLSVALLKTRACENRIFVVAAERSGWKVFDPGGRLVGAGAWPGSPGGTEPLLLDLARATDKLVAPGTHVLAGRKPRSYAF